METVLRTRPSISYGKQSRKETLSSPGVAIILPFQPTLTKRSSLVTSVNKAITAVKLVLSKKRDSQYIDLVIEKLNALAQTLNYCSSRRSVAIYVSPVCEKIIYLDALVHERITVGDNLNIRDLLLAKRQDLPVLLMCITDKTSRLYLCNDEKARKMVENNPVMVHNYLPLTRQKKPFGFFRKPFPDEKYLLYLDAILQQLLEAFPYPLILLGTPGMLASFEALTDNKQAIVEYIPASNPLPGKEKIENLLSTFERQPARLYQKFALNQVTYAHNKRIVSGIHECWRTAKSNQGRFLLLNEGLLKQRNEFLNVGMQQPGAGIRNFISDPNDIIGQTIEKIFENGGDVQLIQEGILPIHHQAMIFHNY